MSELLYIETNALYDGGFQFSNTGSIQKLLEATGMDHCNVLPTHTRFEALKGNMRLVLMLRDVYPTHMMESNTRPYISFAIHQWARFIYNKNV